MTGKQAPSARQFVIRPLGPGTITDFQERLRNLGSLEILPGPEPLWVLSVAEAGLASQVAWERLSAALGPGLAAHPVFLDEQGHALYPTGLITVRFTSVPTEAELNLFARDYDLENCSRNKFVPAQATFAPRRPAAAFLPEVIEKIQLAPQVKSAWPETISKYHRI